jgi:hypothetical protein
VLNVIRRVEVVVIRRHVVPVVVREVRHFLEVPGADPKIGNRAFQSSHDAGARGFRAARRVDEGSRGQVFEQLDLLAAHRAGRVHQDIGIGALNRSGDRQVGLYGRLLVRLEEERLIDPVVASVAVAGEPPTGARTFIGGIGNAVSVSVDDEPAARLQLNLIGTHSKLDIL